MQRKDRLALGFMTFALFLGAGNVIYPPMLGLQAGHELAFAAVGFLLTAVGLPLVALVTVARSGGASTMTELLPKSWGIAFWAALFLVIGPAFAIPRTAVVAYEVGITPYLTSPEPWHLALFTALFFSIATLLALKPGALVDTVGKYMTPALLLLLAAIGIGVFINPVDTIQAPSGNYSTTPFSEGFIQGYMTMDCLAALAFGAVIGHSIRQLGITDTRAITTYTIQAGLIAAVGLAMVYVMLMVMGATGNSIAGNAENGGVILAAYVAALFGMPGKIALSGIISLACLTTAMGVGSASADYFSKLLNGRTRYQTVLIVVMVASAIIANVGLTQLIHFSIPVIVAIYPIAIALVIMGLLRRQMANPAFIYRMTLPVVALFALTDGLNTAGLLPATWVASLGNGLPLFSQGLGWFTPFLLVLSLAWLVSPREQLTTA